MIRFVRNERSVSSGIRTAREVAIIASLTSRSRSWERGSRVEAHSREPAGVNTVARGTVSAAGRSVPSGSAASSRCDRRTDSRSVRTGGPRGWPSTPRPRRPRSRAARPHESARPTRRAARHPAAPTAWSAGPWRVPPVAVLADGWWVVIQPTGRMRHFVFPQQPGHDLLSDLTGHPAECPASIRDLAGSHVGVA